MPSAKSGSAGSIVAPAEPVESNEADVADPGKVAEIKAEQIETESGKYGTSTVKPFEPIEDEAVETTWIEIELVDESDNPVAGERYEIMLPDGRVAKGTLDQDGFARLQGIEPGGTCTVVFPKLDQDAWEFIETAGEKSPEEG